VGPLEPAAQLQATVTDHLGRRLGVGAVRALALWRHRAGSGVEGDQHVRVGIDQRQATGERLVRLHEGIRPRCVEDDDVDLDRQGRKRLGEIGHPHRRDRHVGGIVYLGIDRHEVILAFELHAVAREIDEDDRIRPGRGDLGQEITIRAAQRFLVDVARADHIEAGRLQCLGDKAGIIGRRGKRARRIGGIADDEGKAFFALCHCPGGGPDRKGDQGKQESKIFRDLPHSDYPSIESDNGS